LAQISKNREDAQGSDLAPICGDLSQREKLSEMKPFLTFFHEKCHNNHKITFNIHIPHLKLWHTREECSKWLVASLVRDAGTGGTGWGGEGHTPLKFLED
jgi:hypothetical protein